jgi:predicted RNA-binding protein YlqC (UPF0109 family)
VIYYKYLDVPRRPHSIFPELGKRAQAQLVELILRANSALTGVDEMSDAELKELVEFITRWLVDDPAQVQVTEVSAENLVMYELRVAPSDVGRVIGRKGRTANALRTVLRAAAGRQRKRVSLEIVS